MQSSSPPSSASLSSQNINNFSQQQLFDQLSISQTNVQSINTFLNSYQILKKLQTPIIDIRPYLQSVGKISQPQFTNIQQHPGLQKGSSYHFHGSSGMRAQENRYGQLRKQEDEISEKIKPNEQSTALSSRNKSNCSDIESHSQVIPGLRLPADNDFIVLHSHIKCTNLLSRVRSLHRGDDINQRPMFSYPQWKQVSQGVKKIFNKILQTSMKELNTGTLISIRPNQSLSIRTDYYCFHPHQVYTTFLALDKTSMSSGTLAFCRLSKQFVESEFPKYNDELELLDVINKEKMEVEWEYIQLKEGNLIVLGKDVLYGSFRNDTPSTKFFAEMRWVRHQSASNSSNSS